jgi:hypothetical protein
MSARTTRLRRQYSVLQELMVHASVIMYLLDIYSTSLAEHLRTLQLLEAIIRPTITALLSP